MHVTAILLSAGKGIRFKSKVPKPLVKIASKPVIIYSLDALARSPYIKDIIVVVNSGNKEKIRRLIKKYRIGKIKSIVKGGERRQDSVLNGLKALDSSTDFVLVHDSARPFIGNGIIASLIEKAKKNKAAIAGVPVKFTVKKVSGSGFVEETIPRKRLWEIQTPQVFRKDLIIKAYARFGQNDVTDDSSLIEKLGRKVCVAMGSYSNIKITTPEDLIIAEAIIKKGRDLCRE
jgi:2-C-methyl-D-erythritol 4-phosphate cytidylyltransferase